MSRLTLLGAGKPLAAAYAGPFDGITFAALYGLKRFLTAYTGNLIRLRRDSDNAESDFGYVTATGLLDTAAIATWLGAANGFVVTWYDQSGNGRNATQATAINQPAYVAEGQNSLPVIRSTNAFRKLVTVSYPHFPSKRGAFVVAYRQEVQDVGRRLFATYNAAGTTFLCYTSYAVSGIKYKWYDGAWQTMANYDSANFVIQSMSRTGDTAMAFRENGTLRDTLTLTDAQPSDNALVICNDVPTSDGYRGYMTMLAEFWSVLSAADENTIGNELATLYGLSWNTVS